MPSLLDIDKFKATLKNLGNETKTLSLWGETWQDVKATSQEVSDDIASLLELEDIETFEDSTRIDSSNDLETLSIAEPSDSNNSAYDASDDSFSSFLDEMNLDSSPETINEELESVGIDSSTSELIEEDTVIPDISDDGFDFSESFSDDVDSLLASENESSSDGDDFSLPPDLLEGISDELPESEEQSDNEDIKETAESYDTEDTSASENSIELVEDSQADLDAFNFDLDSHDLNTDTAKIDSFNSGTAEKDSFDDFKLDDQDALAPGLGDMAFSSSGDDLDEQLLALDGDIKETDTFSLEGSWDGDFNIPGFEMGKESPAKPGAKTPKKTTALEGAFGLETSIAIKEKQARKVELSEAQVDTLQDTLLSYPLNLRLAIEDIIANQRGTEAQQADLVWMLVEGALARDAAKLAGKVLKRYIEVPAGFTKRSGAAFEADKGTFRYALVHTVFPVLRLLTLVAAATALLFFLGYSFVYRPLKANSLYSEGHRQIYSNNYAESMVFFEKAVKLWLMKHWHFRYAEAFSSKEQYRRAEEMYEKLLFFWPKEKRAAMEYAKMEYDIYDFAKTESILQKYILDRLYFDKEVLSLSALNFLSWADFEEQSYNEPEHIKIRNLYEKARLQLATLMERHGRTDSNMEMMLLYLMRTDKFFIEDKRKEVLPLVQYALGKRKLPWRADTLAELGNYLLDKDELENVNAVLLKAVDIDGSLPEAHAAMARWNRVARFPKDELKALEYAAKFFKETYEKKGLSAKRLKTWILSMIRLGELRVAEGKTLDAEDAYKIAIENYERATKSKIFRPETRFSKAYSLLADIYYSDRLDFSGALAFYDRAEKDGYTSPETDYRRGYIYYNFSESKLADALKYFYRAGLDKDASPYLLLATANSLYLRGDYFAAQGYFFSLAKRLQFELDTLQLPSPQQRPSHKEIVELLMITRNNLGASIYRVAERMGDGRRRADAMLEFAESARLFDSLSRDISTMIRSDSKNLGFLNSDFILHPMRGIDINIYKNIPAEMDYPQATGKSF